MKKRKGWKESFLLQSGKDILIKAVAQLILTYAIFCFKLPKRLINELNDLITKFWWGSSVDNKGFAWVKLAKALFPSLEEFN